MRAGRSDARRWLAAAAVAALLSMHAQGARIKELGRLYGPMENPIVGYGLVVGLPGTGDDAKFAPAIKLLANMLANAGAPTIPFEVIGARNVAVVMVSATLPPYHRIGDRLDVEVAAVGNAKSLAGGKLVICMLGARDAVFAIASGEVQVGAGVLTTGAVPQGAIVQRELPTDLTPNNRLTFKLLPQNADFSIASRIVDAIHQDMNIDPASGAPAVARAVNAATIEVALTPAQLENPVPFISRLERLIVPGLDYDMEARVVIDEKGGRFYAINGNVEISPVFVGFNNIQLEIRPSRGDEATTLDELVLALNRVEASPADVIGVLKALEAAGALHAKVERR